MEKLKFAKDELRRKLENTFKEIWETKKIPEEWKNALSYPLHKRGAKTIQTITEEFHSFQFPIKFYPELCLTAYNPQ